MKQIYQWGLLACEQFDNYRSEVQEWMRIVNTDGREVQPFGCCRCFCQYCAFADLVSFSTTNFPLCSFKLTCLVVLFD